MTKEARLGLLDNQILRLQRRLSGLERRSYYYSWVRFIAFFLGLLATGLALYLVGPWLAAICLLVGCMLFGIAVTVHGQLAWSMRRHQRLIQIKSAHIARATLDWERLPPGFHHPPEPDHPFEADLDLVGQRSLLRLLDTAVSHEGSQRLRTWLAAPVPDLTQVTRRQHMVRELVPRYLFRDKLALNAAVAVGAQRTWKANQLLAWLERGEPVNSLRSWLILFSLFAILNAVLFFANQFGWIPAWWQITFVLYLGLWLARSRAINSIWTDALAIEGALRQLQAVLGQLETVSYQKTPHLEVLCAPFVDPAHRPSKYMRRTTRVVAALGMRENPIFRFVLNALLPWDFFFAYRLSQTKAAMARYAPGWLEVWFELEALSSLANFAFLNPDYSFPQFLTGQPGDMESVFHAEALGHPLLPDEVKVCNEFVVPALGQVTIITGSNMAGKSVFLKTVGANLALAQAGGPVNARCLRTMPFRLFTCMGISDSVTDGYSFFYAEVRRLKFLLTELERDHPLPLLFGIDEIFRGTNNRERLIGSRAYVRSLAGQHGLGLIATHDLELARLADGVPQVVNYHFRDHIADGRMVFDYRLRPGPCPTTNALKIMQLAGLPVSLTG
jgi:hypothetical protein